MFNKLIQLKILKFATLAHLQLPGEVAITHVLQHLRDSEVRFCAGLVLAPGVLKAAAL